MKPSDQLLGPRDVQRILGLSQVELWRRQKDGRFPLQFRRINGGQHGMRKYLLRSELEEYLAKQELADRDLLTLNQVIEMAGWGRTTVYRRIEAGLFPRPCHSLRAGTNTRWSKGEVEASLERLRSREA